MNTSPRARRLVACLVIASAPALAFGQIRTFSGSTSNTLPRNDDGSTGLVNIGFNANFFGTTYSQLYVNNNGNLTFDNPLSTFTPFGLVGTSRVIIAPFFGDVDTRGLDSSEVTYGSGLLGGHDAFAANYVNVGDFAELPIHNSFQVVLVNRSDIAPGDFDFEFNYTQINWETGQASGSDSQGLGGSSARVGYSNGSSSSFELAGSAVNGALLDSNLVTGLIHNSLGTPFDGATMLGRYDFSVRNGVVVQPMGGAPEPATFGLFAAIGLLGLMVARRRVHAA